MYSYSVAFLARITIVVQYDWSVQCGRINLVVPTACLEHLEIIYIMLVLPRKASSIVYTNEEINLLLSSTQCNRISLGVSTTYSERL